MRITMPLGAGWIAAIVVGVASGAEAVPPTISPPVIAVVNDPATGPGTTPPFVTVAITGSNFGVPHLTTRLKVRDTVTGGTRNYGSRDTNHIVTWEDNRIVATLPPTFLHPQVWIVRGSDNTSSATVTADRYDYTWFEANLGVAQTGGNPAPLALAVKGSDVYLLEEFHRALKFWKQSANRVEKLPTPIPLCPNFSCFSSAVLGPDQPSTYSDLGESVVVDDDNRVWFSEGGGTAVTGVYANHSRLLAYDTSSDTLRAYNLPGDYAMVNGIAWDAVNHRMWFASQVRQSGLAIAQYARLLSFDPDTIDSSVYAANFSYEAEAEGLTCDGGALSPPVAGTCSNDQTRGCFTKNDCVLADKICPPGGPYANCYREYVLPQYPLFSGLTHVGHLVVAADGAVWYTSYIGIDRPDTSSPPDGWADGQLGRAFVGRFDPSTGEDRHYPLYHHEPAADDPCFTTPGTYCALDLGPWEIFQAANGDIVVSEYDNHAVARLDGSRVHDPACLTMTSPTTNCALNGSPNATCKNPCVDTRVPPDFESVEQFMHSVAEDAAGNVWFTQGGFVSDLQFASSIGFWKADRSGLIMFPSPSIYVDDENTLVHCGSVGNHLLGFSGAGIAVNKTTGEVWFSDFCSKRIGRVRKRP
jgi:hypothetical protein